MQKRRMRRNALWLLLAAAPLLAACDDVLGFDDVDDLEDAERLWARKGPPDYSFVLQRSCFCGVETIGPVIITVENRVVKSRKYVATGEAVSAQYERFFPAMEGVFQVLRDAIRRDADVLDVDYDDRDGHVIQAEIDYIRNAIDDELTLSVTELTDRTIRITGEATRASFASN